jgi:hypothetical protein
MDRAARQVRARTVARSEPARASRCALSLRTHEARAANVPARPAILRVGSDLDTPRSAIGETRRASARTALTRLMLSADRAARSAVLLVEQQVGTTARHRDWTAHARSATRAPASKSGSTGVCGRTRDGARAAAGTRRTTWYSAASRRACVRPRAVRSSRSVLPARGHDQADGDRTRNGGDCREPHDDLSARDTLIRRVEQFDAESNRAYFGARASSGP